jgi:hypothetical protein
MGQRLIFLDLVHNNATPAQSSGSTPLKAV